MLPEQSNYVILAEIQTGQRIVWNIKNINIVITIQFSAVITACKEPLKDVN